MRTIEDIETELEQVNDAIRKSLLALEYTLDTTQNRGTVKRNNIKDLQAYKDSLLSELSLAKQKEDGTNISQGRGTW